MQYSSRRDRQVHDTFLRIKRGEREYLLVLHLLHRNFHQCALLPIQSLN